MIGPDERIKSKLEKENAMPTTKHHLTGVGNKGIEYIQCMTPLLCDLNSLWQLLVMAYIRILNMKAICCKDLTVKEIPTTVM
jgi:hypothetical protein